MEISKENNKTFPDFTPRKSAVLLFALTALLGSLATVFCNVPLAATIATPVLAAVVFIVIREPLSVCLAVLPAILAFSFTGDFSVSALWLGFAVSAASAGFLVLGKKYIAPLISALIVYTAAAVVFDPVSALIALIPILLGATAGFMLPRFDLTATVAAMSTILAAIIFCAFTSSGGSLAQTADALREEIVRVYLETEQDYLVITRDLAEQMAAMIVNLLPGGIFVTLAALSYVSCSAINSILRISGLKDEMPESMTQITLSPVSGLVYLICFICSLIFGSMTGELEMVAAVSDNVILCISPAFLIIGCRFVRNYIASRIFRQNPRKEKLASIIVGVSFLMLPSIVVAAYIGIGVGYTLIPFYRHIIRKIQSHLKK